MMITLTLNLPPSLDAQLTEAARRRQASKTALLLEALREYLARQAVDAHLAQDAPSASSPERPTVAELVGHLAGCLDGGPPDLSTNKKYMEGFGE
jgi:Ribbon-helix-helix protein, copG family